MDLINTEDKAIVSLQLGLLKPEFITLPQFLYIRAKERTERYFSMNIMIFELHVQL